MVDIAQLVERQFVALNVAGSSPVIHPFSSLFLPCWFFNFKAFVAQWIEQWTSNPRVVGSNPIKRKIYNNIISY